MIISSSNKLANALNNSFAATLYYKIAEPRVIRIFWFLIYAACFWSGVVVAFNQPETFLKVIGPDFVLGFALFILVGSIMGLIAVLPGIWWLERVSDILLFTCAMIYEVILVHINATPIAEAFVFGFSVCLAQRWIEIRGAQLAPRGV